MIFKVDKNEKEQQRKRRERTQLRKSLCSSVNESKAGTNENGWEAPTKEKIRWLRLDSISLALWSNAREKRGVRTLRDQVCKEAGLQRQGLKPVTSPELVLLVPSIHIERWVLGFLLFCFEMVLSSLLLAVQYVRS